jgi:MFS transporter, putative metabolite:H+ symporter
MLNTRSIVDRAARGTATLVLPRAYLTAGQLPLGVSPVEAAHLFVIVSLTGMIGRTIFSLLPQWIGRRRCGEITGYGIAASLSAAGLFSDGGFANIVPYSAEIFPVGLSARGADHGRL